MFSTCVCAQTFKPECGFGGSSARYREAGFQGFRVHAVCSEKVLLFITSTHMSTYVLRLPDFPGIVMSISDSILLSIAPNNI